MQDLPPALDTFNDTCIRNQAKGGMGKQHEEKIQQIVNQAKVSSLSDQAVLDELAAVKSGPLLHDLHPNRSCRHSVSCCWQESTPQE